MKEKEKDFHLEDIKNLNKKTKRKESDLISEEKPKIEYNINKFKSDPTKIEYFKNLSFELFPRLLSTNQFCAFVSVDDIYYLIYLNNRNYIISYNLISNQIINKIKYPNEYLISKIYHYCDKKEKKDIILTLSSIKNSIKLWNVKNMECFLYIKNIYPIFYTISPCFLNYNNNNYIITCHNSISDNSGKIKIFDFKGNKICEINDSDYMSFFVDTYYDKNLSQYYIIGSFNYFIQSYKYDQNSIYHKYIYNKDSFGNTTCNIIIDDFEGIIQLISSFSGNIYIWNYHSGELLKTIKNNHVIIHSICLWNNKYLFIGCSGYELKLLDLNNEKVIKDLRNNIFPSFYASDSKLYIQKIRHPQYGECLLTRGNGQILKLWINKDYSYKNYLIINKELKYKFL